MISFFCQCKVVKNGLKSAHPKHTERNIHILFSQKEFSVNSTVLERKKHSILTKFSPNLIQVFPNGFTLTSTKQLLGFTLA
jgi:hypothetical protein